MTGSAPFDSGLQPERTGLAWRRTILALVASALVGLRLFPPVFGGWGLGAGVLTLAVAAPLGVLSERRFRRMRRVEAPGLLPDGRLTLALALVVTGAGGFGLLYVLVAHAR